MTRDHVRADEPGDGFLTRWARRKAQGGRGGAVPAAAAPVAEAPCAVPVESIAAPLPAAGVATRPVADTADPAPQAEPLPTLADVALLTRESDYSRFVVSGVDETVKRAAMKKLFADPHFNLMDGLDTYIDDYGKPDPIPLSMLRQMNQSKFLRLFDDEDDEDQRAAAALPAPPTEPGPPPDDDPDLQLQQDDAARRPGPRQGPGA